MDFDLNKAGLFRANPNANGKNNIRIVSQTPGTPQEDTLADLDTSEGGSFTGFDYTGADGTSKYYRFFLEENPTAEKIYFDIQIAEGTDRLKDVLAYVIGKHEVDPVIDITVDGVDWTIKHYGSGTITNIYMNGAAQAFTRAAIPALSLGEGEGPTIQEKTDTEEGEGSKDDDTTDDTGKKDPAAGEGAKTKE